MTTLARAAVFWAESNSEKTAGQQTSMKRTAKKRVWQVKGLTAEHGAFLDTLRRECYHHIRCLPSKTGETRRVARLSQAPEKSKALARAKLVQAAHFRFQSSYN